MKTLRDILFARHQAAMPKLDAIRQSTVATGCDRRISTDCAHERRSQTAATTQNRLISLVTSLLCCSNKLWLELIWPCRRIWTGLATVWILIFVANVSMHDGSQTVIAKSSTTEMIMTFRDQQKFLNELFAGRSVPVDAERPRIFSPKPRTETMKLLTA